MRQKAITIKDIGRELGISPSTVSRALNNYADINKETRDKVMQVAKKLNYTPNVIARSLVTNSTNRIGVLVEDFDIEGVYNAFYYEILTGFKRSAMENGYEVVLLSTTSEEQKQVPFERLIIEKQLAGVFVMGLRTDDEYFKKLQEIESPVVLFDIPIKKPNMGYISVNNIEAAKMAMEHLIGLGHRKIAYVNGHKWAYVSEERLNGYLLSLMKNNIAYDPSLCFEGDYTEESGVRAAEYLMDKGMTAIFFASDMMAIGAMKRLQQLGYEIPTDLSIVGFDNINLSSYITPTLTTVNQDKYELGRTAYVILSNLIAKQPINQVMLDAELIIRHSTAAPLTPKQGKK